VTYDVVVCGAGPAGSVAARRLAAGGARVALIGTASRPGWEGLSGRSRALLADEGLDPQTEAIAGPFARRGVWADGRAVDGTEWLTERSQLAELLRAGARSAGADYRQDRVTGANRGAEGWRVGLADGRTLTAPILIDARGRRGAQHRGPLLLAFAQRFRRRTAGASGTGIGVTDASWCWWAGRDRALWVQVVGRPRAGHPASWIAAAAAQVPALARALDSASLDGDAVARPAHARLGTAGSDPTLWLVGDAALALDPLSGQGVYEALRGARLAATAIQSVLDGGDAGVAQRFVAARRTQAWRRGVGAAAGFYRENGGRGAFWSESAAAYEALLAEPPAAAASAIHRLQRAGNAAASPPRISSGG
jgi:2-polyprenyl-6-methoxyphenol hydroxylase-like FAD-dependent oxidoreductase